MSRSVSFILTPERIAVLEATTPIIAENIGAIIKVFYRILLGEHPEVSHLFNKANQRTGKQPTAIAGAIVGAMRKLKQLDNSMLQVLAHKHMALRITSDMYPIIQSCFMKALTEAGGSLVTPELLDAWGAIIQHVSDSLIGIETDGYVEASLRPGGWDVVKGPREFEIASIVDDAIDVKSFYLKPTDGGICPEYTPGQFITLLAPKGSAIDGNAPRHYTVSGSPRTDGTIRITVKHLKGDESKGIPPGVVSSWLHAQPVGAVLPLVAPFGVFTRQKFGLDDRAAEVYICAGIGITPALSMVPEARKANRKVGVVVIGHSKAHIPLLEEISSTGAVVVENYTGGSHTFDLKAALGALQKAGINTQEGADYLVVAPTDLMSSVVKGLINADVDGKVCYEDFGPRSNF